MNTLEFSMSTENANRLESSRNELVLLQTLKEVCCEKGHGLPDAENLCLTSLERGEKWNGAGVVSVAFAKYKVLVTHTTARATR